MHPTLVSFALLAVVAAPAAAQNLIYNGDFERTRVTGCEFNLTNPSFAAQMPGCTGFGKVQGDGEIDIMEGSSCGYGPSAPSGSTMLGIAADGVGTSDAFSFTLTAPLAPGRTYRLRFQANAYVADFSPDIGAVEVGLSKSATSFGTLVAALVPSPVSWSQFDGMIVPAAAASYLTVRYPATADGWDHIDDFRLELVGPASLALAADDATISVAGATPGALVALMLAPDAAAPAAALTVILVADATGGACCAQGAVAGAPLQISAVDLSSGQVSNTILIGAMQDAALPPDFSAVAAPAPSGSAHPPGMSAASPPGCVNK